MSLAVACSATAMFLAACAGEPAPPAGSAADPGSATAPPNVVVLVVDCLRADRVGAYRYARATTPNIDRLAADAILFERAISASNWTKPSVASLLTGTLVSQHRLTEGNASGPDGLLRSHVLSADLTTLAEAMSAAGLATGGFVNQGHLAGYMGFDQGYDVYRTNLNDHGVVSTFDEWLGQLGSRPFFAYLHLLDLHFPYTPQDHIDRFSDQAGERRLRELMRRDPGEFRRLAEAGALTPNDHREVAALYDGELLGVDDTVRLALDVLRGRGLYQDTLVVLTSDHGEAFWEHGRFEHGDDILWDEVLRVPLLLKLPGNRHAGSRVDQTVRVIDVMPTVLAVLDRPAIEGSGGHALLEWEPEGLKIRVPSEPAVAESADLAGPKAIYLGDLKYVFGGEPGDVRVYDLITDPGETEDLADRLAPSMLLAARARLDRILTEAADFAARFDLSQTELRPEEIEKLRALGYIR